MMCVKAARKEMNPEAIPFLKTEDDASAAAEAPEGPPADNEGDLDKGPPVADGNEPAPGAEVAVEGHPADGKGPPPHPRRSRCRRKGRPSPQAASFARREKRQEGRGVSAVALFLRRCAKRFCFGVRCFFFCAVAQVIVFFGVRRFFVGVVAPFLSVISVIIIIVLAVS